MGLTNSDETSLHLMAHPLRPSIILSPSLPPFAPAFSHSKRLTTAPGVDMAEVNKRKPYRNQDLVIQIGKEDDASSASAAEADAAASEEMHLPEAETVGGRCRFDDQFQFRLVSKCGQRHIYSKVSLETRCLKYTRDIFTTMVDLEWKYHLVVWLASFCLSWVGFGFIWWFTVTPKHLGDAVNETHPPEADLTLGHVTSSSTSCLERVEDIASAILFSIETQSTIGYGSRYIRPDCHPLAYLLLCAQILAGVCIAFFLSGIIYRKLSRPYGRASTILFSRCAVVRRDDSGTGYRFEFRMGDIRKSHVIGTSIRALMVKDRLTSEGERIPLCQYPLRLDTQSSLTDSFIFMPWPVIVSHVIDCESPLWTMSHRRMLEERFEIIVMFEGVVESTGASTQFRTSYLPSEVLWGQRFTVLPVSDTVDCFGETRRVVDFGDFDKTSPVEMDGRSAKEHFRQRFGTGQRLRNERIVEEKDSEHLERQEPDSTMEKPSTYGNCMAPELETIQVPDLAMNGVVTSDDVTTPLSPVTTPLSPIVEEGGVLPHPWVTLRRGHTVKPQPTKDFGLGEGWNGRSNGISRSRTF